jgi:aminoglycoside 6-adenylyltransferase
VRNDKEVLQEIKTWGLANPAVRTVILTSSRANPNATPDLLSDYDVEVAVSDRDSFLQNEDWLTVFGKILAVIREDKDDFSMCLVLYKDYVRIDFTIYDLRYLKKFGEQHRLPQHWDIGYTILIDKDKIASALPAPGHTAYVISRPSNDDFALLVNDFWWDSTYVAKSLWRNELYYAKYMFENVIRFSYLQKMIEWHIGCQYNWQVGTNKYGRAFKKYLDAETWAKLQKTYTGSGINENWDALFATTELFRQLATTLAGKLNYPYPQKTDDEIMAYLVKIKGLGTDAIDIQ